jgi:hypothetical protein
VAYEPGTSRCPECGDTDHKEYEMPKITVAGGATNSFEPEPEEVAPEATPEPEPVVEDKPEPVKRAAKKAAASKTAEE